MKDLADKVALVTGAGNGIGRATAVAFARAGADVVLNDLRPEPLDAVRKEIELLGRRSVAIPADVARRSEAEAMCDQAVRAFGRVDVLVNNAGVAVGGRMEKISIEDWEWIFGVNVWAHVYTVRKLLPQMLERGSGHLVHVASLDGLISVGPLLPYGTTKFAVVGLAEALAAQVQERGVGVTVVCPGPVATGIMERSRVIEADPAKAEGFRRFLARGISPERVGEKIVRAVRKNRFLLYTQPSYRFAVWFRAFFPQAALRMNAVGSRGWDPPPPR